MFDLFKVELTTDLPLNKKEIFGGDARDKNLALRRNSFGMQLFVHTKFCSFVVPESHFYPSADGTVAPLRSLTEKHEFAARQVEYLFVFDAKLVPILTLNFVVL